MLSTAAHLRLQPTAAFGSQQLPRRARGSALRAVAGKLSPDTEKKAIERQIKRSASKKPKKVKEAKAPAETDLLTRQVEAKKWVQAYLDRVNAEASAAIQADLRAKPLLPSEVVEAALVRQHQNAGAEEAAAPATAAPAEAEATNGGKFDPCEVYDDGSVLYTSSALGAVNYEDILTG